VSQAKDAETIFVGFSNWLGASTGPGWHPCYCVPGPSPWSWKPRLLSSSISPLSSLTLRSLFLASRPHKTSYGVWGSAISSPVGSGAEPQPKSKLARF